VFFLISSLQGGYIGPLPVNEHLRVEPYEEDPEALPAAAEMFGNDGT